jgi:hypothetical protein
MRARTYPAAPRSVNLTCPRISVVMPGASCIGGHVGALSHHPNGLADAVGSAFIEGGMAAQSDPRRADPSAVDSRYYYRRSLSLRELVPALGAAAGAAAVTFYFVKLLLERTPLGPPRPPTGTAGLTLHRSGRTSATPKHIGRR